MRYRLTVILGIITIAIAIPASGQTKAIPRTPDGHPDFQGIWTNATITPLERPAEFAGKSTATDAEARAFEKKDAEVNTLDSDVNSSFNLRTGGPGTGAYNQFWTDRGSELARVDGTKRTSLIVDPPDGKLPARSRPVAAPVAEEGGRGPLGRFDDVKDRPLGERCIVVGGRVGPPMMPGLYNNNYQIVQTPDYLMIQVEEIHDTRIIRINGTHEPGNVRQFFGDSIGHWEGDTLVAETTNFDPRTAFRGSSPNLKVIERFRRVDPNTILYRATIDDPSTFAKPLTVEFPFLATKGPVYEYACQEGNYSMPDILGGARKQESATK